MPGMKIVMNDPKSGKSFQREISEENAKQFFGMKVGDNVKGELLNLTGYEFIITGGSDDAGFPMRKDVSGVVRKKILAHSGVGFGKVKKGMRLRKSVAGNTIYAKTAQLNLKIFKEGAQKLVAAPAKEEKA